MTGRPETQVEGGGTQAVVESLAPLVPSIVKDIDKTILEVRSKHGVDLEKIRFIRCCSWRDICVMKSFWLAWPTVKLVLHEFCGLSER